MIDMKLTSVALVAFTAIIILPIALVPEVQAQASSEIAIPARAKPQMTLQVKKTNLAKLQQFCDPTQAVSSKRGRTTTYTCNTGPGGASTSIQARPQVARADINCDYSQDGGGALTWLGCTCTSNDEGNCNNFITNCVEGGDDVGGNSGSASCDPPSDP